jgi:hypothetical protein
VKKWGRYVISAEEKLIAMSHVLNAVILFVLTVAAWQPILACVQDAVDGLLENSAEQQSSDIH